MIVGIYAEGRADQAVITNILKGALNIDSSDLRYELPEYHLDQTDLHTMPTEQHSSWTVVKKVCSDKTLISEFFNSPIAQDAFIIIQIDTAERYRDDYNVKEPQKQKGIDLRDYTVQVRGNVISKVNEWLDNSFEGRIAYAITIEETDAWILTMHDKSKVDTCTHRDPKSEREAIFRKTLSDKEQKKLRSMNAFDEFYYLSRDFSKSNKLNKLKKQNHSLELFCDSLEAFKISEM